MMSEKAKKWIEAGKLLAIDPNANISCPECGLSHLETKEIIDEHYTKEIERMIYCPKCDAKNFIKLSRR